MLVDGIERLEWHPFLLPHETLATLVGSNPDAVQAIIQNKQVAHPHLQAEVVQWAARFPKNPGNKVWLWGFMVMVLLLLPI